MLSGTVADADGGVLAIADPSGPTYAAHASGPVPPAGTAMSFVVRRDRITLTKGASAAPGERNAVNGRVVATEYQGTYVKVTLDVASREAFVANIADDIYFAEPLKVGDEVTARWATADVHILERADTGAAIDPYAEDAA